MAFDRSKFKGGNRAAQKEVQDSNPKRGGFTKIGWHRVEEGRNEFRLAPPHQAEHSTYELYRTASLECNVPIWENGEKTDKMELKNRKIVSGTVHCEALKDLGQEGDPIELYTKMIRDNAMITFKDKTERQKFLAPITGYWGKDKKWVWGIEARSSFLVYAWDVAGEIGKLELYTPWVREMDKLAAELEDDGALDIDPFSNVDEGYPIIITKGKNEAGKWEYTITHGIPSQHKRETWDDFFQRTALTDEQLQQLSEQKSLFESYVDSYKMRDFEMAVEGLKLFDEKHGFALFDNDEFLEKLENINAILEKHIPAAEDAQADSDVDAALPMPKKEAPKKAAKKAPKKAPKKVVKEELDMYGPVVEYVTDTYGAEYVPQIPNDDAQLEAWFNSVTEAEANGDLPLVAVEDFEVEEGEPKEEPTPEPEVKTPARAEKADGALRSQIANLRNRRK